MSWSKELVAASATPIVLSILSHGDNYGYAIIKRVHELTDGEMQWTDGMLYPVLHRLEKQGFLEAEWRKEGSGRKRKYYRLCNGGVRKLAQDREKWEIVNKALETLWEERLCST